MEAQLTNTNPALRLNNILLKAKATPIRDAHQQPVVYKNAWCKVFEIENPESDAAMVTVIHMLLELRKLFDETIHCLMKIERLTQSLYIAPIVQMKGFIGDLSYLFHYWEQYISQYLSERNMTSLDFAVDTLSQSTFSIEKEIPKEEIEIITGEVNDLYQQILNSTLPDDLKNALLKLLEDVQLAMREYQIRGAVRLKEVIGESIGVLATNKEAVTGNKDTEEIKNLSKLLTKLDETYSRATKTQLFLQSASIIIPALLGGSK